jgi:oligo-alginate lyase
MRKPIRIFFLTVNLLLSTSLFGQDHPNLMLTKAQINGVREGIKNYPLLNKSYQTLKNDADAALGIPINVPIPKDGGGGFTHEQHKKNYSNILNCGIAYQISGDKKYADYVKSMLLNYASQYQAWPIHPKSKDKDDGGRIFWQSLNDFVWQIYAIQGYDLVYETLSKEDKATIENKLFIPILKFFTEDRKGIFDQIHNHGTWNLAAVGITGYVINQPKYVEMAIKGSNLDGKTGYLAQMNQLFSPDGYYMEGPYYQRYALLPFILFAKAIHNFEPKRNIYDYRNQLLSKAIQTSLQSSYTNKVFFPVNDAIKDKNYESAELVYGVDLAYADMKPNADLLDIAVKQNKVIVSDAGLKVAKAIAEQKTVPFKYKSQWLRDGGNGDEGGLGILRYGPNTDQQCLVFKATSHGMGHGHFDRLNMLFYDHNGEIFSDYGSARFLNIDTKGGGKYLPENDSWAKQTVAHNTLVVDQSSNFNAKLNLAQGTHPELVYFNVDANLQVISAKEENAYPGVKLIRTSALVKVEELQKPLLIDIFHAQSESAHQYDLPFWYQGQLVNTSFKFSANTNNLQALGDKFGYQHLWLNSVNQLDERGGLVGILNNNRFYTTHFVSENPLNIKLVTLGANDPNQNLVTGKAFILSQPAAKNQTFVSITETHGNVDSINEMVAEASSNVQNLTLVSSNPDKVIIAFELKGKKYEYAIDYTNKKEFIKFTNQ